MPNRTHTDDLRDVLHAAEQAITAAMQDGQHKYDAGNWLTRSMEDHLQHAAVHIQELTSPAEDVLSADQLKTDLAHLVCRAVMAWARQKP